MIPCKGGKNESSIENFFKILSLRALAKQSSDFKVTGLLLRCAPRNDPFQHRTILEN